MNWHKAEFYTSFKLLSQLEPSDRFEFAFSGRSNVGKSTLINKLLNRKSLARVSQMPGKTATINFYDVDGVYLADLPGYGYAKVSQKERESFGKLIEGYLSEDRNLKLVVQLIDFRHPPSKDDLQMVNFLIDNELPFVVVLTKADKLKKKQREKRRKELLSELPCADEIIMIEFSGLNGEGVEELKKIIEEIANEDY